MLTLRIVQPDCNNCSLAGSKQVWGRGPSQANLVVVGEAPGHSEVEQGEPFIGKSGELLRRALQLVDIDPQDVFFTNTVLCRPPANRDPSADERGACSSRLFSEVMSRNPSRILLVGSQATLAFFGQKIFKMRGAYHFWNDIPVICSYHPAFVLYNPNAYRDFIFDLTKLGREPQPVPNIEYEVINKVEDARDVLQSMIDAGKPVSLDIETSKFNPYKERFGCTGLMNDPKKAFILEEKVHHDYKVKDLMTQLGDSALIICHNGQFEYRWLSHKFGIKLNVGFDTMLAHHALDERSAETGELGLAAHDLKTLGGHYFDMPNWSSAMDPYKGDFLKAPKEILYKYLTYDLYTTLGLYGVLEKDLEEEELTDVFYCTIMPGLPVLAEMTLTGIDIDWPYLCKDLDEIFDKRIEKGVEEISKELDSIYPNWRDIVPNLNFKSPKQMAMVFYDIVGLPIPKTGRSTSTKTIRDLIKQTGNTFISKLRWVRTDMTVKNNFCVKLPELIQDDGRIHGIFVQHGTETGRLTSKEPNMQNIPKHYGYEIIRNAFIAPEGWEFLDVDYKQLEFRVTAAITMDPTLIRYVLEGRDIHTETARIVWGYGPTEKETGDQRRQIKNFVFGWFFRRGAESISREYDIPLGESKRIFKILNDTSPGMLEFYKKCDEQVREYGYTASLFGRRRRFPLLLRENIHECFRQGTNHPIQSTASDMCFQANTRIYHAVDPEECKPLISIHDGLLLRIRSDVFEKNALIIKAEMEKPPPFHSPVPFLVDMKRGINWGEYPKGAEGSKEREVYDAHPNSMREYVI